MNIHPPLSAFPAVIVILLLAAELVAYFTGRTPQSRTFLLVALACALPVTYFSGYVGAEYALRPEATFQIANEVIDTHRTTAQIAIFLALPVLLLGFLTQAPNSTPRAVHWTYLVLLVLFAAVVLRTSFLGGELVFEHGAGVFAPAPSR